MEFSGLRILVTGGTSGMGEEIVTQLANDGHRVVTCGRDQQRLDAVTQHRNIEGWTVDVSDPTESKRLVERAVESLGGLDLVLANAGIQNQLSFTSDFDEQALELAANEIAINLLAPIALAGAAMPHLNESGGQLAAMSSVLAYFAKKSAPVYCASKGGLHLFLESLRYQCEDAGHGVNVQEFVVPMVVTPMTVGRNEGAQTAANAAGEIIEGLAKRRKVTYIGKANSSIRIGRFVPALPRRKLRNV